MSPLHKKYAACDKPHPGHGNPVIARKIHNWIFPSNRKLIPMQKNPIVKRVLFNTLCKPVSELPGLQISNELIEIIFLRCFLD